MRQIDFTKGNIFKNLVVFSLPILLGEALQNLYNTVDTIVVGNFAGEASLAAVSVCNTTSKLIVSLFSGISVGAGVVISKAFGFGNKEKLRQNIQILITFSVFLGILISVIGLFVADPLLKASNAREDYFDLALIYLLITFGGIVFTCVYNFEAGALRAIGDSAVTLKILIVTGITNAVLDYIFVRYFSWGVTGAAVATVISEATSSVIGYFVIKKRIDGYKVFSFSVMKNFGRQPIKSSMSIGVSVGLQSAVLSLSNIFVLRYVNVFPTTSVAGISTAQRIETFATVIISSLSSSVSTAIAQNIGAGKFDRVKPIARQGLIMGEVCIVFITTLLYIFAPDLVRLFNDNPEVIASGTGMVRALVPFYSLMCIRHILFAVIRPYNKSFIPALIVIFGMVVLRQAYLAVMMTPGTIETFFYCYPFGWFASFFPALIYYFAIRKNLRGLGKNIA